MLCTVSSYCVSEITDSVIYLYSENTGEEAVWHKSHKHLDVPRQWYSRSRLLMSNVVSLSNELDGVIVAVKSMQTDNAAWQTVPEICAVKFRTFSPPTSRQKRRRGCAIL